MRPRMCTIYDAVLMLPRIYFYDVCSLLCSQGKPGCIYLFHLTLPPPSPRLLEASISRPLLGAQVRFSRMFVKQLLQSHNDQFPRHA